MYEDSVEEIASAIRQELQRQGYGVPYDGDAEFYVSDVTTGDILAEVIIRPYADES